MIRLGFTAIKEDYRSAFKVIVSDKMPGEGH